MSEKAQLSPGDLAPELKLKDQSNRLIFLRDFRGKKWVILYFYPKSGTPLCTKEACYFRDNLARLSELGAQVLAVNTEDYRAHRKFDEKHRLDFPLLSDPTAKVTKTYEALAFYRLAKRVTFLIDKSGRIRRIFRKVNPESHVEELIEALQGLQAEDAEPPFPTPETT